MSASIVQKKSFGQMLDIVSTHSLAQDPRRPQYHLLPAANWMNDPNAPIYWSGKYHMFYQYNPDGAYWGDMHWGHSVSSDMVHWRHLPIALAPTKGGPDAEGCFSGSAVIDGAQLRILYTGIVSASEGEATSSNGTHRWRESQCLAVTVDDNLTKWNKDPRPVIGAPPRGMNVRGFRDPCAWRQNGMWYLAVGSGITREGGTVLLYSSRDLRDWEYVHELFRGSINGTPPGNAVDSGEMWECPDFFSLGDKHILIHSTQGKAYWQCGTFDAEELVFHPETGGLLDYGSFYAPKSQLDRTHNRILWGWIMETRPEEEYKAERWAGMMSLPRVLTLDVHNHLQIEVAHAAQDLRRTRQNLLISEDEIKNREQIARMCLKDCCGEIVVAFKRDSGPLSISLYSATYRESPWLTCSYDPSTPDVINIDNNIASIRVSPNQKLECRFLIDGSVIESFIGKEVAYTKRFYYDGSSAPDIGVQIAGKTTALLSLVMWQLSPISPDRLTT